jgi:DNA-binding CsgD family transcriptional regulator
VSLKQLRRSRIYALWFRPNGIERELNVAIPSPPWHTKTFLFDRRPGRDFTERDRLVLDLLQPHFGRLWRAGQARRRLQAAMAGLEWASEEDRRGLIVLAPDGRIEAASPPARRLLREYFDAPHAAELPPALAQWLKSNSSTLTRRCADRRLAVERSGDALLLEETRDELGLTPRERQILAWVARGKTNAEVAAILWIAPSTVRKHLENIYAKIGVRTRTAAVTRFLGALGDEGRQGSTST